MCCEKSREPGRAGQAATESRLDHAEFSACLKEAMHAMAQPITLLRSHFYLARERNANQLDSQQHLANADLADADLGMERLCTVFRLMQELVQLEGTAAQLSRTPLASILSVLADDAEVVFAGSGLTLQLQTGPASNTLEKSESIPPPVVEADLRRTRHALMSMLHTICEGARPGSAILCSVASDERWAEILLRPEDPFEDLIESRMNDVVRLRLALARANALSQRAVFVTTAEPFALSIKLPVAIGRS